MATKNEYGFPYVPLNQRRIEMGYTLSQLAAATNLTKSHLCKVCKGHAPLTAFVAQQCSLPLQTPWFCFFPPHESLRYIPTFFEEH